MAKDLQGITVSFVPVPKMTSFPPETGTVFLPSTKMLFCFALFSSSVGIPDVRYRHFDSHMVITS